LFCCCIFSVVIFPSLAAQAPADSLYDAMRGTADARLKAKLLLDLIDKRKYANSDSPRVWASELLEMGKELDDPGIESDALTQLAWLNRTWGNHSKGIEYAADAIKKAGEVNDQLRMANALLEVGQIQREQYNFPEAEKTLKKGFLAFQEVKNLIGQGRCINVLGEVSRMQKHYPQAKEAYLEARTYFDSAHYEHGILITQNNLGLILEAEGKFQEALDSLGLVRSKAMERDLIGLFLESTDAMARCYLKLGDLESAERFGKTTYNHGNLFDQKKYARDAAKTLSDVYVAKNDLVQAMDYLRRHYELANELVNDASQNRIKSLNLDLELQEKQGQIEALSKDDQIRQLWSVLGFFGFCLVFVVGVILYVSNRRKRRDNLLLASQNDALAELVLEKDSLINIVAHDLKSPINKTKGLISLLASTGEFNPQQQNIATMIERVLGEGDRLIRDLLDISQAEGNQSSFSPTNFELCAMISSQIMSHEDTAAKKNIHLHYGVPSKPLALYSDESFVGRVFDNLLSNAIKYSPKGSTVKLDCGTEGDRVWFSVMDQGPGFSAEDQEKMYRKFQRLSARPTGGESSNGLGLAIIRLLVAQMKGEVRLHSEPGKGAKFVVLIPKSAE
jgi:signal transduction histidine kinase